MDDGSRHGSGLYISVYGVSNTDVDKLMFTLQDKFNLKCSALYIITEMITSSLIYTNQWIPGDYI